MANHYNQNELSQSNNVEKMNIDSNNNSAQTINQNLSDQPKLGLKLVLRRQSNNNYEITNTSSSSSVNTTSILTTSSTSSTSTRPKREASRKVKFRFSDSEYEIDTPKPKRAKTSRITSQTSYHSSQPKKHVKYKSAHNVDLNNNKNDLQTDHLQLQQQQQTEFTLNDIVTVTNEEKLKIYNSKPLVLIEHSRPFPICLVEDKTDIVCTKAVLFIHLFQTYSSPCIGCPLCKSYLNINEFSKHIHPEEDESDEEDDERKRVRDEDDFDEDSNNSTKKNKSYKILPYCMSGELNESDLKIWKLFSQRVSYFKQTITKTKSHVNSNESNNNKEQKLEESSIINNDKENIEPKRTQATQEALHPKQNLEFNQWDYVNTTEKLYVLTDHSINSDNIVYLNKNGDDNKQQIIYERQVSDDLNLSETEDDADDEEINVDQDSNQTCTTTTTSDSIKSPLPTQKVTHPPRQPLVSLENDLLFGVGEARPTRDELYYNMYENLSKDKLFYIVDNQYTIIPDSYIYYVNKKREHYFKQLKLARSNYFQKKWLNLSLDLEFKIN